MDITTVGGGSQVLFACGVGGDNYEPFKFLSDGSCLARDNEATTFEGLENNCVQIRQGSDGCSFPQ